MGYSCTVLADDALREIQEMYASKSNFWKGDDGREYFFDIGRENEDGAITGTVIQMNGKYGKKIGSVRIEPNGFVTRFPHLPKRIMAHVKQMNKKPRRFPAMYQVI